MTSKCIKSQNGVTLISLVVTIVIILILSTVVVSNVNVREDVGKINNMYGDILLLQEKVLIYYNKYNLIPKSETTFTSLENESIITTLGDNRNINDNEFYYIIDISKLENVTTNFGTGELGQNDVYIINDRTLTIYYLNGIEFDGDYYYAYPYSYSQIDLNQ